MFARERSGPARSLPLLRALRVLALAGGCHGLVGGCAGTGATSPDGGGGGGPDAAMSPVDGAAIQDGAEACASNFVYLHGGRLWRRGQPFYPLSLNYGFEIRHQTVARQSRWFIAP